MLLYKSYNWRAHDTFLVKFYYDNLETRFEIPSVTWEWGIATFRSTGCFVICNVRSSIRWSFSFIMLSRCEIFCCNVEIVSFFSCSSCFRRVKMCRGTVLFANSSGFSIDFIVSILSVKIKNDSRKGESKDNLLQLNSHLYCPRDQSIITLYLFLSPSRSWLADRWGLSRWRLVENSPTD